MIEREANALAYAKYAIAELTTRIRFAVADQNDAEVAVLDEELRRMEAKFGAHWK
ncbi:hypothetical protein J2W22_001591 [Sphingomonas kyeonggiensis]|uniref:hypothetical protein n=1 Tax=Sphingomonas kyeonggiensis TaxID=1268553 RepID=UPI00277DDFBF|nr:hypothetical protein [Sphingomonas kyeonggiensis]MDQ0249544.1 hypothetical protein [Sphingomonas kyeonggiensis]